MWSSTVLSVWYYIISIKTKTKENTQKQQRKKYTLFKIIIMSKQICFVQNWGTYVNREWVCKVAAEAYMQTLPVMKTWRMGESKGPWISEADKLNKLATAESVGVTALDREWIWFCTVYHTKHYKTVPTVSSRLVRSAWLLHLCSIK